VHDGKTEIKMIIVHVQFTSLKNETIFISNILLWNYSYFCLYQENQVKNTHNVNNKSEIMILHCRLRIDDLISRLLLYQVL
jgi:hypothetical protein